MFTFNSDANSTKLNESIAKLLTQLEGMSGDTEEYTKTTTNLAKLMELRNQLFKTENEATKIANEKIKADNDNEAAREKIASENDKLNLERDRVELDRERFDHEKVRFGFEKEKLLSWRPSPDAVVGAAASVIGIAAILHYEKLGVVTSKALGFVNKMK
jgi:hypothetical protein